ncbi:Methanol O-anthraniloyltransferase [Glycine soja]
MLGWTFVPKPIGECIGLNKKGKGLNECGVREFCGGSYDKRKLPYWDTSHVRFYNVDFGWGSPSYGGPAGAIPFVSFYGRFRDSEGEDWVVVPILLPHHVMKKFLFELVKITVRSL